MNKRLGGFASVRAMLGFWKTNGSRAHRWFQSDLEKIMRVQNIIDQEFLIVASEFLKES